jgi:hypothetical protein
MPRHSTALGSVDHAQVLDRRPRAFQPLAYPAHIAFQSRVQPFKLRPVGIEPNATQADTQISLRHEPFHSPLCTCIARLGVLLNAENRNGEWRKFELLAASFIRAGCFVARIFIHCER